MLYYVLRSSTFYRVLGCWNKHHFGSFSPKSVRTEAINTSSSVRRCLEVVMGCRAVLSGVILSPLITYRCLLSSREAKQTQVCFRLLISSFASQNETNLRATKSRCHMSSPKTRRKWPLTFSRKCSFRRGDTSGRWLKNSGKLCPLNREGNVFSNTDLNSTLWNAWRDDDYEFSCKSTCRRCSRLNETCPRRLC